MHKSILLITFFIVLAGILFAFNKMNKNFSGSQIVSQNQLKDSLSIYSYSAKRLNSDELTSLNDYNGKVLLIVNTASKCGLTPQYKDLQALYEEHKNDDFMILGFPSNDFLKQEPGSEEEIASFCQRNYGVSFDMFQKVHVKGKKKHPVYQFLTEKEKNGVMDSKVTWNFQKYLIDKQGKLVAVFKPKENVYSAVFQDELNSLLNE